MYYDTKTKGKCRKWVNSLGKYVKLLNDDHRRELGNQTPSDIYFGRNGQEGRNKAAAASKYRADYQKKRQVNDYIRYSIGDYVVVRNKRKHGKETFQGKVTDVYK